MVAVMLLLGTPAFISCGATQYADTPISFFYLSTSVLLAFRELTTKSNTCLYAAFTMAGLAAWTKNEGLLFLVVASAAHLAVTAKHSGLRRCLKDAAVILAAAAPCLALLSIFKHISPANDISSSLGATALAERLLDPGRYAQIITALAIEMVAFNHGLAIAATAALLILGRKSLKPNASGQTAIITLLLMGLCIAGVFLLTPHDLQWHLDTALERLIIQLWPSAIFAGVLAFDFGKAPEHADG